MERPSSAIPIAWADPAQIVAFYSYKGGPGRTMALANVAWLLASAGKRVLAVDWDLESPGLHRYFRPFLQNKDLNSSDGVTEMLGGFAREIDRLQSTALPALVGPLLVPSHEEPAVDPAPVAEIMSPHTDVGDNIETFAWPYFRGEGRIDVAAGSSSADAARDPGKLARPLPRGQRCLGQLSELASFLSRDVRRLGPTNNSAGLRSTVCKRMVRWFEEIAGRLAGLSRRDARHWRQLLRGFSIRCSATIGGGSRDGSSKIPSYSAALVPLSSSLTPTAPPVLAA